MTDKPDEKMVALLKHAAYSAYPELFVKDVLGINKTWWGQDKIMRLVAENPRVSVSSGHSAGKDWIAANLMLWFLCCFPGSIVIATAPSDRQVEKVMWGELTEKYYKAKIPIGGRLLTKQLIMDEKQKWYAIGFTTKDIKKSPGRFQSFHAPNVMMVFSEAQAIERLIWEQGESLMTAGFARWLAIGNPLLNSGAFYDTFKPGSGWKNLFLDCEDTPNVKEGKEIIPGICSKKWVDDMARIHGRDSIFFLTRVKGRFPPTSSDCFISGSWIEWARTDGYDVIPEGNDMEAGVDPASYGSDKTVIAVRKGMKLVELKKYERQNTMQTAGLVKNLQQQGVRRVKIDVGGLGIGIFDRVGEETPAGYIIPVNFGSKPDDGVAGSSGVRNSEAFADMAAQMYFSFAQMLENKKVALLDDQELELQLTNRKMKTMSNGKMRLEPKDEFKARGFGSPDEADAVVLCYSDAKGYGTSGDPYIVIDENDGGLQEMFT